jgi:hypothetical protein
MLQQFDAYRAKTGVDSSRLREDTNYAIATRYEVAQLPPGPAQLANAKLEIAGGFILYSFVLTGKRAY